LSTAVTTAISRALTEKSPIRCVVSSIVKSGYGYLLQDDLSSTAGWRKEGGREGGREGEGGRDGGREEGREGGSEENIQSIILVAELDPKPVGESDCGAKANGGDGRDGPGWGEEEDV
jgi:hypothetical protein